ncbi:MAG: ATP-binding cassette domain-containing protein [Thermoguttaceae bacterium]|nr:ATP-binding cassette domain-containing protein [Thermoguttaceae bacterium]MDW8080002.1 ATP-binding cassette domain-containing protein [Thermoguttaceae bacterium]
MTSGDRSLLSVREVSVIFWRKHGPVRALAEVSLEIKPGEFVALVGSSGSGKSLLARVAAGELAPSAGNVLFDGLDIYERRRDFRAQIRTCRLAFMPQLPDFCHRGDLLAHVLKGLPSRMHVVARERAERLLEELGLGPKVHLEPRELSAGELQRLALVRALAPKPELAILDNPTAQLDDHYASKVAEILKDFHLRGGAVLLVSNDQRLRKMAGRIYRLENGVMSPI